MILTNHPDQGAPMTLELLARCYLDFTYDAIGIPTQTIRVHRMGDEMDEWEWTFIAWRERVAEALRAAAAPPTEEEAP